MFSSIGLLGVAIRPNMPAQNADPSGLGLLNSGAERSEALAAVGGGPHKLIMLAILAMLAMPAQTQPPAHRDQLATKFRADLERLATVASGVVGISVIDLTSGQRFDVNQTL